MKRFLIAFVLMFSISVFAQENGEPRVISRSRAVFDNTNCADTNTCDLKQVRYLVEDYEILIDGNMSYGTRFFAHYSTDTVGNLENYAFVQFIKGCQYNSYDTGEISASIFREHFNELVTFNHRNWVVDSIDTDPIYFSTPEHRHFNYKWNVIPSSINQDTVRYYGVEKPNHPEVYITDRPGSAFYANGGAKNISLAFKVCLYRTSDIPRETTPENTDFAEPINCYYWYSSWVYDHTTSKFQHPYYIALACNN